MTSKEKAEVKKARELLWEKKADMPVPPDGFRYEQLPNEVLERAFGDFKRCEGLWNELTEDEAEKLMNAASAVLRDMNDDDAEEYTWASAKKLLRKGNVISFPLGYLREMSTLPKCPRCGASIVGHTGAISRVDPESTICADCGVFEAVENMLGIVRD